MEMSWMELQDFLTKNPPLPPYSRYALALEAAQYFDALHARGEFHPVELDDWQASSYLSSYLMWISHMENNIDIYETLCDHQWKKIEGTFCTHQCELCQVIWPEENDE